MLSLILVLTLGQSGGKTGGVQPMTVCQDGQLQACTKSNCAIAAKECSGGYWGTCLCLFQTCNDNNPCTTDGVSGFNCVHTPTPGVACSDGNACTTGETCNASAQCTGGAPLAGIDDHNSCTTDTCNTSTGAITHTARTGVSCDDKNACTTGDACSSGGVCTGTFTDPGRSASTCDAFCYDKYGYVTQKITCLSGQACGGCP